MKVALALLAEYAVLEENETLNILRADVNRLQATSFPYVHGHLALVIKLAFESSEWGSEHAVQIRVTAPDGSDVRPIHAFSVSPEPPADIVAQEGEESSSSLVPHFVYVPVIHSMRDLRFDVPGQYTFSVVLPGEHLGATINLELAGPLEDERSLHALLRTGYRVFVSGDLEGSWAIFDQLVKKYPDSAYAHNDFGFVNLASGRAKEALRSFQRAKELGFELTELLDANIACCWYLLGDYQNAFASFRSLMGVGLQSSPSVLHLLDRKAIRPIQLTAAVHFLSLMALNAGFSALEAGLPLEALQFAQIATAGRITFVEPDDAKAFIGALEHLTADCESAISVRSSTEEHGT